MDNFQQSLFFLDIAEATYSDLDCLKNLFYYAEDITDYWSLMQPDCLRQIISNAEQSLLEICLHYMNIEFDTLVSIDAEAAWPELQPSWPMMLQIKKFIDGDIDLIGQEVGQYEYSYQLFISSKQKYENCLIQVHGEPTSLGSAFSAPLSSLAMLQVAEQEFEKRHQQLSQRFAKVLQNTIIHLEDMQERAVQAIFRYIDRLGTEEL